MSVLNDAIQTFGANNQMIVAIEEMSELTKELCKINRTVDLSYKDYKHICEEMADVTIMLEQLRLIFNNADEVDEQIDIKLKRLEKRISEFKATGRDSK